MFTRKDFEFVSKIIATLADAEAREAVAGQLADHFEKSNPRFQRDKFLTACLKGTHG